MASTYSYPLLILVQHQRQGVQNQEVHQASPYRTEDRPGHAVNGAEVSFAGKLSCGAGGFRCD